MSVDADFDDAEFEANGVSLSKSDVVDVLESNGEASDAFMEAIGQLENPMLPLGGRKIVVEDASGLLSDPGYDVLVTVYTKRVFNSGKSGVYEFDTGQTYVVKVRSER